MPVVFPFVNHTDVYCEERPWGRFHVLMETPSCKVKRLEIEPGQRLSLQSHQHRQEHQLIIGGRARVTLGNEIRNLCVGDSVMIPVETRHRMENPGMELLTIIEIQLGSYFGEDDIIRYEDDYNRIPYRVTNHQPENRLEPVTRPDSVFGL